MPETFKGTVFLLALVTSVLMMPVEKLPAASWQTALGLGFVFAVFDTIPLTALALKPGRYDGGASLPTQCHPPPRADKPHRQPASSQRK